MELALAALAWGAQPCSLVERRTAMMGSTAPSILQGSGIPEITNNRFPCLVTTDNDSTGTMAFTMSNVSYCQSTLITIESLRPLVIESTFS